jgi:hypothetical protein
MGRGIPKDVFAKRGGESHLEWELRKARTKADARDRTEPLITREAAQHGDYRDDFVTHVETGTKAKAAINRGGSPVCRWEASGKLDNTQMAVIAMCQRLWRLAGLQQRVTATYGERVFGMGNVELAAMNEIEARSDLKRISGYFPGKLSNYWDVFENICRHGIPAGVAGASVSFDSKAATARSLTIVRFVADYVATREGVC